MAKDLQVHSDTNRSDRVLQVIFENTLEDYQVFSKHYLTKTVAGKKYCWSQYFQIQAVICAAALIFGFITHAKLSLVIFAIIQISFLFYGGGHPVLWAGEHVNNKILERRWKSEKPANMRKQLSIIPSGLRSETADEEILVKWPSVRKVEEVEDRIFVAIDGSELIIIPCNAFDDQQKKENFISNLKCYSGVA